MNPSSIIRGLALCSLLASQSMLFAAPLPKGEWSEPESGYIQEAFILNEGGPERAGWGGYSPYTLNERRYFNEFLPALFERTLVIDSLADTRGFKWIFTSTRTSLTVHHRGNGKELKAWIEYYDSPALSEVSGNIGRHPSLIKHQVAFTLPEATGPRSITVKLDHKHDLSVTADGVKIFNRHWPFTFSRHQLQLTAEKGEARFRLLTPETREAKITVDASRTHQKMIGWGGIGSAMAYRELSDEGRKQWWKCAADYNLLFQREYPTGAELKRDMSNWDDPGSAKAHYYAENFPNGETSDFGYNTAIQQLGGFTIFEFWNFPPWVGDSPELYATAMVEYCRVAKQKTGKAPYAVGVQNEIPVKKHLVEPFVTSLRSKLDAEGFSEVKIHAANAPTMHDTIGRRWEYLNNPKVWDKIDYAASNTYDIQKHFRNPDGFDAVLEEWGKHFNSKPFMAVEVCVNAPGYQNDGYLTAFTYAQSYHKLLTKADAVIISYCWTLLTVEQPTYAATRTLFTIDRANGFMPVPGSHQLRAYGAYSRRIQRDMVRTDATSDDDDLFVSSFMTKDGRGTLVLLNRGVSPVRVPMDWAGEKYAITELVDPYHQNAVVSASSPGPRHVMVPPGAIVTLSDVPLVRIPAGFKVP